MAKRLMAIPLALSLVLGLPVASFAQTRGDVIRPAGSFRIADLPAGHWATNATMVAIANNILVLESGQFNGQRPLTNADLRRAMEAMVNTSENIAGQGALSEMRAALGTIPSDQEPVSRLQLTQILARFLDAANNAQLVAMGAPRQDAGRFNDLGSTVPMAVRKVVDTYKVMTGYPDGSFRPSETVTRYQMAAIAKEILDDMRAAPIAQQPAAPQPPVVVEPQPPTVVVVPPEQEEEPVVTPEAPTSRRGFRANAPVHLSWQALNQSNLQPGAQPFSVVPITGMFTGYAGPVMLQNVTNFRYDVFQSNLLDTEFRLGYGDLKLGPFQLIPYVGANLGLGASIPQNTTQYDTYVGASYGGILSWLAMDNLEISGFAGQSALLGGGRWNTNFQPTASLNTMGTFLTNYGVMADFYVAPNIALTLGANNWQIPSDLRTATSLTGAVTNVLGGNLGVGFRF